MANQNVQAQAFAAQREQMVRQQIEFRGIRDRRVLDAMLRVPREQFMPAQARDHAYTDEAVAIGRDQTISQPYMVARMTQELDLAPGDRVLEVGTGSGYQSAVLAELVGRDPIPGGHCAGHVFTVERLVELSESAARTLGELGYTNVRFAVGDGSLGWPAHAPFDAILLTAGAPDVPPALIDQLSPGGRFVGPVGPADSQVLVKWSRALDGEIIKQQLLECRFVRLIGEQGWER